MHGESWEALRKLIDLPLPYTLCLGCSYETELQLRITLPLAFPLHRATVAFERMTGIPESRWRFWELQMASTVSARVRTCGIFAFCASCLSIGQRLRRCLPVLLIARLTAGLFTPRSLGDVARQPRQGV